MPLERATKGNLTSATVSAETHRTAQAISWSDTGSPEPTWENLEQVIRVAADRFVASVTGSAVDASWASFSCPQTVHKTRYGDTYRKQRAWALGPLGLTAIDARQAGTLREKRLYPLGEWSVRTTLTETGQGLDFRVIRRSARQPLR